MSPYTSLLDVAEDLATDPSTKAAFAADPEAFLADRGLEGFTVDDLGTAMEHVADSLPPDLAAQVTPGPQDEPADLFRLLADAEPGGQDDLHDLEFGAGTADGPATAAGPADGDDPGDELTPPATSDGGGDPTEGDADDADPADPAVSAWSPTGETDPDEGSDGDDLDQEAGFGRGSAAPDGPGEDGAEDLLEG